MRLKFIILLVGLNVWTVAEACLDPLAETRTFFETLPSAAMSKPAIAKVEIIATTIGKDYKRISKVKVLQSIKGVTGGSVLTVFSETHSCNQDPEIAAGKIYFISGSVDGKNQFSGVWKRSNY